MLNHTFAHSYRNRFKNMDSLLFIHVHIISSVKKGKEHNGEIIENWFCIWRNLVKLYMIVRLDINVHFWWFAIVINAMLEIAIRNTVEFGYKENDILILEWYKTNFKLLTNRLLYDKFIQNRKIHFYNLVSNIHIFN